MQGRFPKPPHKRTGTVLLVLAAILLIAVACRPVQGSVPVKEYGAPLVTPWYNLALQLVKETPGYSPPVAARTFGYMGVALYETLQPGMRGYDTLAGQLNALEVLPAPSTRGVYYWPAAANRALAETLRRFFPSASPGNLTAIDALEEEFAVRFRLQGDEATFARSAAWGDEIAHAIFIWSTTDGGHEGYTRNFPVDYVLPVSEGLWVPTPPGFATALQPYWGNNRPFVLSHGDACPATSPIPYSEAHDSTFFAQALEVYEVGRNRTEEQLLIARFWADDPGVTATPPGHWISILSQVLVDSDATLERAAEAYAKMGMALADAFITCWYTKYEHLVVRPITYIQQVIDADWNATVIIDPVLTPPFPEYTSGHSVQSSAAAAVLSDLFGPDYGFTDRTPTALGLAPRTFASFEAAAQEAAISRLYGGIHYPMAIEAGLEQGKCVAARVLALQFQIDGSN